MEINYVGRNHKLANDYIVGTYYDKETSGEDVSAIFNLNDIIPPHRTLTRQNIEIKCKVIKLIDSIETQNKRNTGDTLPHYLNKAWIIGDIFAICLLIFIGISSMAKAHVNDYGNLLKHFIATIIAGNVLIPSMKLILLYNIFNLIMSISFYYININSYKSLAFVKTTKNILFDKTGTLTEENMFVNGKTSVSKFGSEIFENNYSNEEIEFMFSMANNCSNQDEIVWGFSPEENEILKYWTERKFKLIFNPLTKNSNVIIYQYQNKVREFKIIERKPYCFQYGKIATIEIDDVQITVRQHGTDFMDKTFSSKYRSLSIAIEGIKEWIIVVNYTFENPLRSHVKETIEYLLKENFNVSILTGDGQEASENIGKQIGFDMTNIIRVNNFDNVINISNQVLSIEGSVLEKLHKNEFDNFVKLINVNNSKIMFRVPKYLKAIIVENTENNMFIGDASNDALAIKNSIIGVALKHGAKICKLNSSIIINEPSNIYDIFLKNGFVDMTLIGAERLLKDVCWLAGLITGCLFIGLIQNKFEFLNKTIIYQDIWNPLPMLIISSMQYTISVISYCSSECNKRDNNLIKNTIFNIIFGLLCGTVLAFFIRGIDDNFFDVLILHGIDIVLLIKHSAHCLNLNNRKADGTFGNQMSSPFRKNIIIYILNILDSIPVRILLYIFFYFMPIW